MTMNTQTTAELSCIEINPPTTAVGTVILLHGLGADGNDFVPLIAELKLLPDLPIRFVFPHAPLRAVTINNGYVMRAWYDIVSMSIDQHADLNGITDSVKQLESLIEKEEKRGIPANKIVLAGFSQGAVIALTAGLRFSKRLAGILALSGYFPFAKQVLEKASACNRSTPIFLAHGTEDTVVPYALGQITYSILQKQNYPVTWHSYAMSHSVSMNEIDDIAAWLRIVFKN